MDPGPEKVSYSEIRKSGAGKKVVQRIKSVQRKMELKKERERGRKGGEGEGGRDLNSGASPLVLVASTAWAKSPDLQ